MNKLLVSFLLILIVIFSGCNKNINIPIPVEPTVKPEEKEEYLKIVTTNKLLYYMVKDIVKDRHSVEYMLKTEEAQWKYNYTEDSVGNISKKDLFIFIGASYEPWVDSFVEGLNKEKVGIVNASRGIRQLTFSKPRKYKEKELKENPYYWLNVDEYKVALANIKNSIQEKDPKSREFYEINFAELIKSIDKYNKDLKAVVEGLKKYNFVVIGDDLDYFSRGMNLKTVKIDESDLSVTDIEKVNKKYSDLKDIILLYDDESKLLQYNELIKKYNMKPVHMITYKFDMTINEIYRYNYEALNKILQANLTPIP